MANVEYLICSFCQGPSSRLLRPKLTPHLSNPSCRIRSSDLDWLDKWRLLLPAHVEWDLQALRDAEFQSQYESELPKTNLVSKIHWIPSIEGRISDTPEWDDLDGWRTIEFRSRAGRETVSLPPQGGFEHLLPEETGSANIISKRTLHPYNDDIEATRLPFHSACLRILYESCNEVAYSSLATSTVNDVVASILLPSWKEGDVNMDWLSRRHAEIQKRRLISPWAEHWHPLDPSTNFLAVDPSRPLQPRPFQNMLIRQPQRTTCSTGTLPLLLQMPAEVLDLISDFVMAVNPSSPEPYFAQLINVQSLKNLRYSCRQMYHHSFPRIHFLSFLYAECPQSRTSNRLRNLTALPSRSPAHMLHQLAGFLPPHQQPQHEIPLALRRTMHRIYPGPVSGRYSLPYRRIPELPPTSQIDRSVMEIDWEAMYRSWKEGLGWRNRIKMFVRCEKWLANMQEGNWENRPWGRFANYVSGQQTNENVQPVAAPVGPVDADDNGNAGAVVGGLPAIAYDVEMEEVDAVAAGSDYDQFQWP